MNWTFAVERNHWRMTNLDAFIGCIVNTAGGLVVMTVVVVPVSYTHLDVYKRQVYIK